jgi:TatD DNase family protein
MPSTRTAMYIDTHAHLYVRQFDSDRQAVVERLTKAGIDYVFLPNIDEASIPSMLEMVRAYPGVCYPMMGLHPCHVEPDFEQVLTRMRASFDRESYIAVGEIGLDAYWDKSSLPLQELAFREQIRWANELALPIVIHSRDTMDECIRLVREEAGPLLRGVFHCFTGTASQAAAIVEMGFKLGIGGVYTYKNSGLRDSLAAIPLDQLVLETDAPYLAPVPFRGKRNETAYLLHVAEALAADRGISAQEVGMLTSVAAREVFQVP